MAQAEHHISSPHRRSLFCDYSERGIYLITLCTEGRKPLLGTLMGTSAEDAYIQPTALGEMVVRSWLDTPFIQRKAAKDKQQKTGQPCTREIQLLAYQLMPDHFHGIIFVTKKMDIPLGNIINGFKSACTRAYREVLTSPVGPTAARARAAQNNGPTTCRARQVSPSAPSLWEKGYHDRRLTREGQLQNMIDYVQDNPRRLFVRRQHADSFHVQQDVRWGDYSFMAVGDTLLLDNALHAVHVRRRFTPEERRLYMNDCVLAARSGKVLISPFISEYEKQVRDVVLQEGFAVIQLSNEPFSKYYKPSGELFDICANGQLLMLSLSEGTQTFSRRITRQECCSLNTVAEDLAHQSAARAKRTDPSCTTGGTTNNGPTAARERAAQDNGHTAARARAAQK
ncbi:MAG: hypothetical protein IIX38_03070 [Alistipes sp.]|nr:hypothetical protein [Alistipes sp.]